jgi:phage baseplate assembly protein W
MMGKEFIGKGWRFPIVVGPTGALAYNDTEDNVEQSLHLLLLTRLGERVMRGGFGTRLGDLVFAAGSEHNLRAIETEVKNALDKFEPRIDVIDVTAEADSVDPTRVTVALAYRVRRSNTRNTLVFPFYLVRGATP